MRFESFQAHQLFYFLWRVSIMVIQQFAKLSSLIATSCTNLTRLECDNNNIRILDISNCYNLGDLIWDNNPFEEINLGDVASITFHNYAAGYKTTDYPYLRNALNNSTKLKISLVIYLYYKRKPLSSGS